MWQLPGDQLSKLFRLVLQKMTNNGSEKSRRCCTWMTSLFFLLLLLFVVVFFSNSSPMYTRSVLSIPARDARRRVPENQKDIVARYAPFNALRNAFPVLSFPPFFFFFCTSARVLACSWRKRRRLHVCATCCVCVCVVAVSAVAEVDGPCCLE